MIVSNDNNRRILNASRLLFAYFQTAPVEKKCTNRYNCIILNSTIIIIHMHARFPKQPT
jgi:hypothetical protein